MKKIVYFTLLALCLPCTAMAQSNDDDLYFNPGKEKEKEVKAPATKEPVKQQVTTRYSAPITGVVVKDRKGNTRDVDEYNRRFEARDNDFTVEDDTLYIQEKSQRGLEGEWVNGEFEGSQDDYEYAERIIRFRNPRYAISISSPFYWDVVYGMNSWDWNVYTDGLYAYAFPTFSNRLWWDWRFNSFGGGWGWGYGSPYYGWGGYYPGYWGGGFGGYWGGYWGHHHHHPGYYPGWGGGGHYWANSNTHYNNRRNEYGSSRPGSTATTSRRSDYRTSRPGGAVSSRSQSSRPGNSTGVSSRTPGRVISTRSAGERPGVSSRATGVSSRRSTYTRPSSTRNSSVEGYTPATSRRNYNSTTNSSRNSTYNRGSSATTPQRSGAAESSRRSYNNTGSSSRSYTPVNSSGGSSRSGSGFSGGGSSRSSGGGSSRSGGGSSRR